MPINSDTDFNILDIFRGRDVNSINIPDNCDVFTFIDNLSFEEFICLFESMKFPDFQVFLFDEEWKLQSEIYWDEYQYRADPISLKINRTAVCFLHPVDELYIFICKRGVSKGCEDLKRLFDPEVVRNHILYLRDVRGNDLMADKFESFL
jgi:hypothetical protein